MNSVNKPKAPIHRKLGAISISIVVVKLSLTKRKICRTAMSRQTFYSKNDDHFPKFVHSLLHPFYTSFHLTHPLFDPT